MNPFEEKVNFYEEPKKYDYDKILEEAVAKINDPALKEAVKSLDADSRSEVEGAINNVGYDLKILSFAEGATIEELTSLLKAIAAEEDPEKKKELAKQVGSIAKKI